MIKYDVIQNERVLLRIIPHQSVLNNMNRKLWHTFYEIMSMYDSPWSRLSRQGLHFTYRLKDNIWWIITIRTKAIITPTDEEEIQKQIEFYVCMSKTFAEVFKIKLKSHQQWRRCTVHEVPLDTLAIPIDNLEAYQLRYSRANMFSLNHDYTEQLSPVREILHVSEEMQKDDFVGLFMSLETIGRSKWKQIADYAWAIWDKGNVPSKDGFDPMQLLRIFKQIIFGIVSEVKHVSDSTIAAVDSSMFSGERSNPEKAKLEIVDSARAELLINGTLSTATKHKRNLPVFSTSLNLLIASESKARRDMLAHSVTSAFSEMVGDNRLELIKVNVHCGKQVSTFTIPPHRHLSPLLSVDEVGKLIQLPTSTVQDEFKDQLESNRSVEIEIPKVFLDDSGIYMGTAQNRGEKFDIHLPKSDLDMLMTPRVFMGSPRMGKDQAAINLVVESKRKHGIGSVVLDVIDERNGHRGMSDALRDHLPPEDIIDLNLGDFDYPVYIGLAGVLKSSKSQERIIKSRIADELLSFIMGEDMDNFQTREYIREAAQAVNGDLLGIKRILTDGEFRKECIAGLKAQGRDVTLLQNYDNSGGNRAISGPIFVRLGQLTGDAILRPMFCQNPNPAIQYEKWIREGKVIVFRVPKKLMTTATVSALAYWISLMVYLTKLTLGGNGVPTYFILNEPHQYLSKGFIDFCERMCVEGPKLKLAPVFIFHNFEQFNKHKAFVDVLMSSSLNWHIFKNTNDNVYTKLKNYLEPTFTPQLAMQSTSRFQYIACWLNEDGGYEEPFLMNTPKQVFQRYESMDNSFLTKRHSRMYGRHIDIVEKEIQAKSRKTAT